jgi:hypothetical protein
VSVSFAGFRALLPTFALTLLKSEGCGLRFLAVWFAMVASLQGGCLRMPFVFVVFFIMLGAFSCFRQSCINGAVDDMQKTKTNQTKISG